MVGRLCGTSVMIRVSSANGDAETRPAVTNVSAPPSGLLAVERYRSKPKVNLEVGFPGTLQPIERGVDVPVDGVIHYLRLEVVDSHTGNEAILMVGLTHAGSPF